MFDDRYETQSEYNLIRHVFFSVINSLLQYIMLFYQWPNFPHPPIHIYHYFNVTKSYKNDKSIKCVYILLSICLSAFSHSTKLSIFRL